MPTLGDEKFEEYLKRFRPIGADPLPALRPWNKRAFVLGWTVAIAAALVVAGVLILHIRSNRNEVVSNTDNHPLAQQVVQQQPLTMRDANALLAAAPSFKAAVDDMAFRPQTISIPQGKRSVVRELSKEKIKL